MRIPWRALPPEFVVWEVRVEGQETVLFNSQVMLMLPVQGTTHGEPLDYSINPLSTESLDDPTLIFWLCIIIGGMGGEGIFQMVFIIFGSNFPLFDHLFFYLRYMCSILCGFSEMTQHYLKKNLRI